MPPAKPLMVFDSECRFCCRWITRWQQATGDQVDYLPFQDPQIHARFPEIPQQQFDESVQLIETDGTVHHGADAAFRALAYNRERRWLLWLYQRVPFLQVPADWVYDVVARHRMFFSMLTRWLGDEDTARPAYFLTRWLFLRLLGVVYFFAFVSLWSQVLGLIGSHGILPASELMVAARQLLTGHSVVAKYLTLPTLCWLNVSDAFLQTLCGAGTVFAVLLIADMAPVLVLAVLWLLYLSLVVVSRDFLSFQWDALLLETGFLAIFFAPFQWRPLHGSGTPPSRLVLLLLRWLLFRLMFTAGVVKLASGDPAWRHLTALRYHFETQPLPTWIAWYAHHLPDGLLKFCCAILFVIELAAPWTFFAPRRLRFVGAGATVTLMVLIALTGNYCFFNLLAITLCVVLLDDAALTHFVPRWWRRNIASRPPGAGRWRWWVLAPVGSVVATITVAGFISRFNTAARWPGPVRGLVAAAEPFRSFNNYGLFAVMTTQRPEIIIEGSDDGVNWLPYEFKYKPGDLARRPRFVEPLQPRLDWQMWFAALSRYENNPWFIQFCIRLLQGSPEVVALLRTNPFPDRPPRYLRALRYEYHFTTAAQRRTTGDWWRRDALGQYCPVLSLRQRGE